MHRDEGRHHPAVVTNLLETKLQPPPLRPSAVDRVHDDAIADVTHHMAAHRLVISIAHRLRSVRNADIVLVMDHGELVQRGTFDELISAPGPFAPQWQEQNRMESIKGKVQA